MPRARASSAICFIAAVGQTTPVGFPGLPPFVRGAYDRLSPDGPAHFPVVFDKLAAVWRSEPNHPMVDLARIVAPTLLMLGDHDVLTVEHAAAMQQHRTLRFPVLHTDTLPR